VHYFTPSTYCPAPLPPPNHNPHTQPRQPFPHHHPKTGTPPRRVQNLHLPAYVSCVSPELRATPRQQVAGPPHHKHRPDHNGKTFLSQRQILDFVAHVLFLWVLSPLFLFADGIGYSRRSCVPSRLEHIHGAIENENKQHRRLQQYARPADTPQKKPRKDQKQTAPKQPSLSPRLRPHRKYKYHHKTSHPPCIIKPFIPRIRRMMHVSRHTYMPEITEHIRRSPRQRQHTNCPNPAEHSLASPSTIPQTPRIHLHQPSFRNQHVHRITKGERVPRRPFLMLGIMRSHIRRRRNMIRNRNVKPDLQAHAPIPPARRRWHQDIAFPTVFAPAPSLFPCAISLFLTRPAPSPKLYHPPPAIQQFPHRNPPLNSGRT